MAMTSIRAFPELLMEGDAHAKTVSAQAGIIHAVFEKCARLTDPAPADGAGLGLAICREVMAHLAGSIGCLPGQRGPAFRVTLRLHLGR